MYKRQILSSAAVLGPAQFSTALKEDHSLNAWQKVLHDANRKIGITESGSTRSRAGRINADSQIQLTSPRIDRRRLADREAGSESPIIDVKRHVFDMIHPALEAAVYAHAPGSEASNDEKADHVEKLKQLGRLFGKDGETTFTSILEAKPVEHERKTTSGAVLYHQHENEDGSSVNMKDADGNDVPMKDTKFEFGAGHPWENYQIGRLREENGSPNGPKYQIMPTLGRARGTRPSNATFLAGKVKDSVPLFDKATGTTLTISEPARRLHDHVYANLGTKDVGATRGKLQYLLKDGISQHIEPSSLEETDDGETTPPATAGSSPRTSELFDTPVIDMHGRVDTTRGEKIAIRRPQLELHPVAGKMHADIIHDAIASAPIAKSFSIPTLAFALRKSKESIALKKALMYAKLHRNVERAFGSKKAREGTFLYGR